MSLRSMTAYGRGTASCETGSFTVEIQGTNRRHFETHVHLPRPYSCFEIAARKQISERVGRGMVNVMIHWKAEGKGALSIIPNLPLALGIKRAWGELADELMLPSSLPIEVLLKEKDLMIFDETFDEEACGKALKEALCDALDRFIDMKTTEGQVLAEALLSHLDHCKTLIDEIEPLLPKASEKLRIKLKERLEDLHPECLENEERLLREVALYAERIDTTEEFVRFESHLLQMRAMIVKEREHEKETHGKPLDFLIQELNREINTIGSKSAEIEISRRVVAIKSELEKMREQVQNIE